MDNLVSKADAIELFKINRSLFDELIKKYNIEKTIIKKRAYYDKATIIKIANELEYRRKIRITTWKGDNNQ